MSDSTAPAGPVKCKDCGFLCVRHLPTRELVEVEIDWREKGNLPERIGLWMARESPSYFHEFGHMPTCFVLAHDLQKEFRQTLDKVRQESRQSGDIEKAYLRVITNDRQCQQFVKWRQGHSPKEHKGMIDYEQERKRQKEDREAERQLRLAEKWSDRKWHLFTVFLAATFGIIGVCLGAWLRGGK